jgi:hypothetical protein
MMLTEWKLGVPLACLYNLQDQAGENISREAHFGLVDSSGTWKPFAYAMKTLHSFTNGYILRGSVKVLPVGVHGLKMTKEKETQYIFWQEYRGRSIKLSLNFIGGKPPSAYDYLGNSINLTTNKDNIKNLNISEESGPVYVKF